MQPGDPCTKADGTEGTIQTPGSIIQDYLSQALKATGIDQFIPQISDISTQISGIMKNVSTIFSTVNLATSLFGGNAGGLAGFSGTPTTYTSPFAQYLNDPGYMGLTTQDVAASVAASGVAGADLATRASQYGAAWVTIGNTANAAAASLGTLENSCTGDVLGAAQYALANEVQPVEAQAAAAAATVASAQARAAQVAAEGASGDPNYASDYAALAVAPPTTVDVTQAQTDASAPGGATANPVGSLTVSGGTIADRMNLIVANAAALQSGPQCTSSSGSGNTVSLLPGTYNDSLVTADGRTRTYVLHIPTGYTPTKTYPLVVGLHGSGGTGAGFESHTGFDTVADANSFVVVYPDGVNNAWDDGRGTQNVGINDLGFIRQLVNTLENTLSINTARIYAAGESNGGMMAELLGCQASDIFAAIGPDVGPIPTNDVAACHPAALAVAGIQGGNDPLVPINGGAVQSSPLLNIGGGNVQSAVQTMQLWASINGCNATPVVTHPAPLVADGTSVDQYDFSGCKAGTDVRYYIVQGMGHAWPPAVPQASVAGGTSQNLNATNVLWAFFAAHARA